MATDVIIWNLITMTFHRIMITAIDVEIKAAWVIVVEILFPWRCFMPKQNQTISALM